MKILIAILLIIPTISLAQEIDCSFYNQKVDVFNNEIETAKKNLDAAQNELDQCQGIKVVVESDEYKQVISQEKTGINWTDIKPSAIGDNWNG